jgi:hypothetical protein
MQAHPRPAQQANRPPEEVMAPPPCPISLAGSLGRRSFLFTLASLGVVEKKSDKQSDTVYRFLTPEFEIEMHVQYFPKSSTNSFRFRDALTNRAFCLSAEGKENQECLQRFTGSIAIARYRFRSRLPLQTPLKLRERVRTIDRDSRMDPRPPFEGLLPLDREVVSDIQAFGYNQDDPKQAAFETKTLWCLLRQDLYLNDQATAFLIVHWKHTVDFISLLDVIPGDRTEPIAKS